MGKSLAVKKPAILVKQAPNRHLGAKNHDWCYPKTLRQEVIFIGSGANPEGWFCRSFNGGAAYLNTPLHMFHSNRAARNMVVRRNDRRRRLMNDEFVPTVSFDGQADSARANDEHSADDRKSGARRTYASGADRRNQLRTTDMFPKRTWLIVAFGFLLAFMIVAINALAWNAESWREVLGDEGVAALQLGGTGTLASWFTSFMMLLVALASLQIYALRRHRCDDYVGAYRMWMWFPPIFVVASVASVIDLNAIARNVLYATSGVVFDSSALVPLVVVLAILAVLAGRVLYEVRESRATAALIVLAWLSLAVSATMQTRWASDQIATVDLQIVLGNSYLVSSTALLIGHLFYTRFVYLHAHGLIVKRQAKPAVKTATEAKSKEKKAVKSTSKSKGEKTRLAVTGKKGRSTSAQPPTKPAKPAARPPVKKTNASEAAAQPTAAQLTAAKPATVKLAATKPAAGNKAEAKRASSSQASNAPQKQPAASPAKKRPQSNAAPRPTTMNSFKSLMEKRKSDRAAAAAAAPTEAVQTDTPPATLKMSKAERRRARKAKRAERKAA